MQSEVRKVTSFTFMLPRPEDAKVAGTDATRSLLVVNRPETIETVLVIDDESPVRMWIVDVLEKLRYRSIKTRDGSRKMGFLRSDIHVDFVIVEIASAK